MTPARVWALTLLLASCGGGEKARYRPPTTPHVDQAPVMRAHFIDVGQGDATLLEFPCGAVLVDTGGEQNGGFDSVAALSDYLDAFFDRRTDLGRVLDLVVLTHPHIDHTRGLPMVLERYKVKGIIDDGREQSSGAPQISAMHAWLKQHPEVRHRDLLVSEIERGRGVTDDVIDPIRCADVDPEIRALWGSVTVDPGWPPTPWGKPIDNENNHSIVLRLDFGKASFLFTGDLEEAALETFVARYQMSPLLDVDVYKVGHHGSRNGTTDPLLRAMTPRVAVFSMGTSHRHFDWTAWQYGHPGAKLVEQLDKVLLDKRPEVSVLAGRRSMEFTPVEIHGAAYGTGWDGTIVIEASTRGRLKVSTAGGLTADPVGDPVDGAPSHIAE